MKGSVEMKDPVEWEGSGELHRAGAPHRWLVVADSAFLPARGGGEREHLGFVQAARGADLVAALIVPVDEDAAAVGRRDDLAALRDLVSPAPLILTPRRRSLRAVLTPGLPYVVASRPVPRDLVDHVSAQAPHADAVLIYSYKSHEIGRVLAQRLHLPAVLRQHNVEGAYHQALAGAARAPRSWAMWAEARRITGNELKLEQAAWLSGIADISQADAELRSRRARVPVTHVPPFALGRRQVGDEVPLRQPVQPPVVAFLGALDVATNQQALFWFADEVWPLVIRQVPGARWQILGRSPTGAVQQLVDRSPQTELHRDVASPLPFLSAATVAVNPTVSGSGVNIKLVDYLAAGVPVVSTTLGMQGLGLDRERDLVVADEAAAFAGRVVELLTDPARAAALGEAGRRTVHTILDTGTSLQTLQRLLKPER